MAVETLDEVWVVKPGLCQILWWTIRASSCEPLLNIVQTFDGLVEDIENLKEITIRRRHFD